MKKRRTVAVGLISVLACAASGCSGGGQGPQATPATTGMLNSTDPAGAVIEIGDGTGRYVPLRGAESRAVLNEDGAIKNGSTGVLVRVKSKESAPFVLSVGDTALARLKARQGWTVEEVGRDASWRPFDCAAVPHLLAGDDQLVMLHSQTVSEPRQAVRTKAFLEIYDTKGKTFATMEAARDGIEVFSQSLAAPDAQHISFLFADGPPQANSIPYIGRRTIDLTTMTFVDQTIAFGFGNRVLLAKSVDGGYIVDLVKGSTLREGVHVTLEPSTADPVFPLAATERAAADLIDGFKVTGRPGALRLEGASSFDLPADLLKAFVIGADTKYVYLRYNPSSSNPVVAESVALVDRVSGSVDRAFDVDLPGLNPSLARSPTVVVGVFGLS